MPPQPQLLPSKPVAPEHLPSIPLKRSRFQVSGFKFRIWNFGFGISADHGQRSVVSCQAVRYYLPMLKVGLTGGIGCGKSHILREFHKLGVYTLDADEIAHEVILPDQSAYEQILETFGLEILASDRTIDRKKLGERVFSDEEARKKLNRIVHPLVLEEEARRIAEFEEREDQKSPIIMVDAALMVETGSYRKYDFVVVVYCPHQVQLQRVIARDSLSEKEALQRIQSQMPLLEKIQYADYIIENSGRLSETNEQVKHIFTELVNLGAADS